jgi:hypothetical protein
MLKLFVPAEAERIIRAARGIPLAPFPGVAKAWPPIHDVCGREVQPRSASTAPAAPTVRPLRGAPLAVPGLRMRRSRQCAQPASNRSSNILEQTSRGGAPISNAVRKDRRR